MSLAGILLRPVAFDFFNLDRKVKISSEIFNSNVCLLL